MKLANVGLVGSCIAQELYKSELFTAENTFTAEVEGPAVDADGFLYAVSFDYKETIGRISPDGEGQIFLEMDENSLANGIRFSSNEDMFIADYLGHNILKYSNAELTVFAHDENMNQPNDLAIMDNDILFASDPNWAESTGKLWRITTDGIATCIEESMGTTNGIEVSPDQSKLYVNESDQRRVWSYDLAADGKISNKTLFYQFADGGLDGMRSDSSGNLYIARWGSGKVVVICPEGEVIREISLFGENPTNLAFGGEDGKRIYVTVADKGNIETFLVEEPGRSWAMRNSAATNLADSCNHD